MALACAATAGGAWAQKAVVTPPAATALPTGGVVTSGQASIGQVGSTPNMVITQTSQRSSINWDSFNIGSGAKVQFVQPNSSSVTLNRVVGSDPSAIFGNLSANGQVYLLNPNGVLFGAGSSVNVGSLVATSMALSDADFQAGKTSFARHGANGSVVNQGNLSAATGGYIALLAPEVVNAGVITAQRGSVALAAGEAATLSFSPSGLLSVQLDPATVATLVENRQLVEASGGQILMSAQAASQLQGAVVNSGTLRASGISGDGGKVMLLASSSISHSGGIDTTGAKGGDVTVRSDYGNIAVSGSVVANSTDAANKAGGDIVIGRATDANGEAVLAESTDVSGATLESKGGFVETSGTKLFTDGVAVKAKDWLLDPFDIEITDAVSLTSGYTSQVKASDINAALNNGTSVTVQTTSPIVTGATATTTGTSGGIGNILVTTAISKTSGTDATLTLIADNGIDVNAAIGASGSGTGKLNVVMTASGNAASASSKGLTLTSSIDAYGGTVTLTGTNRNTNTGSSGTSSNTGITFNNGAGITAASYSAKGTTTSTSGYGVYFGGTSNFTSSSTSVDSLIEGTTAGSQFSGFAGVFAASGSNVTLASGNGKASVQSSTTSSSGVRFGFGGGSVINTSGSITLGSQNNDTAYLMMQGTINATGTLKLRGQSGTAGISGLFLQDGSGVAAKIIGTNATISLDGLSNGTASGVDLAATGISNQISNSGTTGSISITGTSTSGVGVNGGTTTISNTATDTSGSNGSITIGAGTAFGASTGALLQGAVTATGDISIVGNTIGTGKGLVLQSTVLSTAGNITVSGSNNSTTESAVSLTNNGTTFGSLTTSGSLKSITINADTLFIDSAGASVNAGSAGAVTLQTGTAGNVVNFGGADTYSASASGRVLGIDSGELGIISAGTITIGNFTQGDITVSGATTVASNLALVTNGNIAINAALQAGSSADKVLSFYAGGSTSTVTQTAAVRAADLELLGSNATYTLTDSGNSATKVAAYVKALNLTNNAAAISVDTVSLSGPSGITTSGTTILNAINAAATVSQTQAIKASVLELLGSGATYTLNNSDNTVGTIAGSAKALSFTNSAALTVDTVSTSGLTTTGNLSLTTQTGDLTLKNAINAGTSTVALNVAGSVVRDAALTGSSISGGVLRINTGTGSIGSSANRITTSVDSMVLTSATDQYVTEANAVIVAGITTNGSMDIQTTDGTLTVGSGTSVAGASVNGLTAGGTGNVTLLGNSTASNGLFIANSLTSAGGNISLAGNSSATNGLTLAGNITATSGDITLFGTSGAGNTGSLVYAGVLATGMGSKQVNAKNITINGEATGTGSSSNVLGFYGGNGTYAASDTLSLTGSSTNSGFGVYTFNGTYTAANGISVTGTSAYGDATGFDAGMTMTNSSTGDINISGTTIAGKGAVHLSGASISNNGINGSVVLTATSGDIISDSGSSVLSGYPFSNTIVNGASGGTGSVQLLAGNSSSTSSDKIDASVLNISQMANGGVTMLTSGAGNVTVGGLVNSGTGAVTLVAGSTLVAGDTSGAVSLAGSAIRSNSGTLRVVSGSYDSFGALSNWNSLTNTGSGLARLYYSAVSATQNNVGFNKAYGDSLTNGDSSNQVLFRQNKTLGNFTAKLNSTSATYGSETYSSSQSVQLARLQAANASLADATVDGGNGNTFTLSANDILNSLIVSRTAGNISSAGYEVVNAVGTAYNASSALTNTVITDSTGSGTANLVHIINRRALTVSAAAANKVYDTTTAASASLSSDAISVDAVSLANTGASFSDKNAGTGKTVTVSGLTISGSDAGNYTLANTSTTTTADITPASLVVKHATAASKTYDGATTASISGSKLSGVLGSDDVTVGSQTGTFADPYAGTGKAVTASISLAGQDAANYTVVQPTGLTADITEAASDSGFVTPKPVTNSATVNAVTNSGTSALTTIVSGNDSLVFDSQSPTITVAGRTLTSSNLEDTWYRPDMVSLGLSASDLADPSQLAKALPPENIDITLRPDPTNPAKMIARYSMVAGSGGLGEIRVFHNGKLIRGDGRYVETTNATPLAPVAASNAQAAQDVRQAVRNSAVVKQDSGKPVALIQTRARLPDKVQRLGDRFTDEISFDVVPGEENALTVVAYNRENTIRSDPTTKVFKSDLPKVAPRVFVLSVGVNEYQDKAAPTLDNATNDARDFALAARKQLEKVYGVDNVMQPVVLTDSLATKDRILAAVDTLAAQARPQDVFVWFVAGHGMLDGAGLYSILPHDWQSNTMANTITSNDLLQIGQKMPALKQVLVADTCQAGGVDQAVSGLYGARISALARNMGLHFLAGAASTEFALDGSSGKNGLFTGQIIRELNTPDPQIDVRKDGILTLMELANSAKKRVQEISRKLGHAQNPISLHNGNDWAVGRF